MAKHARIKRERAEREGAAAEEKERGPISAKDAATRSRVRRMAGFSDGSWAYNTRTRKDIKRHSSFAEKRPKKRREKKRGRR